jgi:superfamily II DNA helicase RecQ
LRRRPSSAASVRFRQKEASVDRTQALNLLQRALGDPTARLRPGQWEAIDALVNHRKKLLVVERRPSWISPGPS